MQATQHLMTEELGEQLAGYVAELDWREGTECTPLAWHTVADAFSTRTWLLMRKGGGIWCAEWTAKEGEPTAYRCDCWSAGKGRRFLARIHANYHEWPYYRRCAFEAGCRWTIREELGLVPPSEFLSYLKELPTALAVTALRYASPAQLRALSLEDWGWMRMQDKRLAEEAQLAFATRNKG